MAGKIECPCDGYCEAEINSIKLFKEVKENFAKEVSDGNYIEIAVTKPCYIGYSPGHPNGLRWYDDKWYKCNICGTVWAFKYPDFPARGEVYKLDENFNRLNDKYKDRYIGEY